MLAVVPITVCGRVNRQNARAADAADAPRARCTAAA
jgi:hypothetical protein